MKLVANNHLTGDPFFPDLSNIFYSAWIGPSGLPYNLIPHGIKGTLFYQQCRTLAGPLHLSLQ